MEPNVCLKLEDAELPALAPDGTRIVAAANGFFRERRNSMFHSSTRIEPSQLGIADHYQYCELRCGKLPRVMQQAMLSFFRSAHRLHGGEAALVLMYHPEYRRFRWHCPKQKVELRWTGGRWVASDFITFNNPLVLPEGYLQFGDCHLHVGGCTAPSFIDVRDEQDGIHIIVGDIEAAPTYHVDFVMDGKRFGAAPELIFEDPNCRPGPRSPDGWLGQVLVERFVPYLWRDPQPANRQDRWSRPNRSEPNQHRSHEDKDFTA